MKRTHHDLKILPQFFEAVADRSKTFEVRRNDRDYKVGDILRLREYCDGDYTGRIQYREISYILDDPAYCKEGFVVLGIRKYCVLDIMLEELRRIT